LTGPLVRLVRLVLPERRRVGGAALVQALTVATGMGLMGASGWLLSKAALHPSIAALQVAIVGVRAFGVARPVLRYLERLSSHDVTLRLLARLRLSLFRALVPLAPARLMGHRGGDLLGRVLEDVGSLEGLYTRLIGPSLAAVAVAGLLVLLLSPISLALSAAAALGLVLAGLVAPRLAVRLGEAPGRRLLALRGQLAAGLVDGVHGLSDLLAFGRAEAHATALAALGSAAAAEQRRLVRASAAGGALAALAADLASVAVLALAVPLVGSGRLDGVALASVALLTLAAFEAVAPLPAAWHALSSMRAAAGRLFEVMDATPAVSEPAGPAPAPLAHAPLLELRELRFSYPGERQPALDGVSLRLERGQRVAVVGASGSGKSTLAHLLLRFWDVDAGSVLLEGHALTRWPSDLARARVAFAAQRAHVFAGTLRENLLLACPDASADKIDAVLRALRLDAAVERLPGGLDAWVGERGQTLSGGERQRLALARALLRRAPLLVLDEPTAHLDALTEREVMAAILRAGEDRGTLLVTHRLVSLDAFDEVLVLDRGRVAERGRAAELLSRDGTLARLLALQRSVEALGDGFFAAPGRDSAAAQAFPADEGARTA
jgi:thiol reductant ABC exporter CydC subunit